MPTTVVTGKNAYMISTKLRELRKQFADEFGETNIVSIDAESASFDQLSSAVFEQGLFSTNSLVVLNGLSSNKHLQEKLDESLETIPESAHLVIVDQKLDKRTSFYKSLKKHAEVNDFPEPDEYSLGGWVQEEFKKMGGEIGRSEANTLVGRVGPDQWALKNELDKLINHDQPISRQTIEDVVDMSFRETIFSLLDLAFSKQTEKTVSAYRDLIANRIDPYYILSMIAWQLHALLVVAHAGSRTPDQIVKEAKLSPFVVKKSQGMLRHTSRAKLNEVAVLFTDVDYKTKTSAATDVEALVEQLLVEIAS